MRSHALLHGVLVHGDPVGGVGVLEVLLAAAGVLGEVGLLHALAGALVHLAHDGALLIPVQAHNLGLRLDLDVGELLREVLDLLGLGGDDRVLLGELLRDVLGAGNESGARVVSTGADSAVRVVAARVVHVCTALRSSWVARTPTLR